MTRNRCLVLDTSVLSATDAAGWLGGLDHWEGAVRLMVPKRVWEDEVVETVDVDSAPGWLDVVECNLDETAAQAPGQLSIHDWRCVALAEVESAGVVSNDKAMIDRFEERGGTAVWGTKFLLRTFERCGMSVTSFEAGVETYVRDVYLPEPVATALRESEKDD